jgi:hypothetical protein
VFEIQPTAYRIEPTVRKAGIQGWHRHGLARPAYARSVTGSVTRQGKKRHFCQAEARLATIKGMGRKDKGREICINCGQTFHKKLTSKELRCTKCRKAEKKAA